VYDANVARFEKKSEFSSDDDDRDNDEDSLTTEVHKALGGSLVDVEFQSLEQVKALSDSQLFSSCVEVFGRDKVGPILGKFFYNSCIY
jgi:hypothetical protein